jgi:hypothetical protein
MSFFEDQIELLIGMQRMSELAGRLEQALPADEGRR